MIKNKIKVLSLLLSLFAFGLSAQQTISLRINEVMVVNEHDAIDGFGNHGSWIEIYNTSAGTVKINGCFLTNDKNNPRMYSIPKSDKQAYILPHKHVLIWADGLSNRGTYHTNFELNPNKANYIALYDADGRKLIDEVEVPAGQQADYSFARTIDGTGKWVSLAPRKSSAGSTNKVFDAQGKIENMIKNDSIGIGMTLTAMSVVFLGLLCLFIVYKLVGKAAMKATKRNAEKATGKKLSQDEPTSGAVYAAISTALYEFTEEAHDIESTVLTIRRVERNYSPWSSKIYTLKQLPIRKK